jgi:hypothetical protein
MQLLQDDMRALPAVTCKWRDISSSTIRLRSSNAVAAMPLDEALLCSWSVVCCHWQQQLATSKAVLRPVSDTLANQQAQLPQP